MLGFPPPPPAPFFFLSKSESLLFLLIGQLEKLVATYLLEWKDSITEPQEQAPSESWRDMKGYSGS